MNVENIASAFTPALPLTKLQENVPAAFASRPYAQVSTNYVFISTAELISALADAGFYAVTARQTRARSVDRAEYARHMIRFRETHQRVSLFQAVPELVLLNSHDATSAYQLRAGLFRPICENGMMCSIGDFGVIHVPHRGDVLENLVDAAATLMRGFTDVGTTIERMATTVLSHDTKLAFAESAARVRYRDERVPYDTSRLLEARRALDQGDDVWHVYNVVQENVMRGGIVGRSASGRSMRTRSIKAIREDVRINTALWHLAMNLIRG